ncbi:hypothetical protein ACYSNR_14955 [Enterococcus sp. LJL128]
MIKNIVKSVLVLNVMIVVVIGLIVASYGKIKESAVLTVNAIKS